MSLQGKPVLMSLNNKALKGQDKEKFRTAGVSVDQYEEC